MKRLLLDLVLVVLALGICDGFLHSAVPVGASAFACRPILSARSHVGVRHGWPGMQQRTPAALLRMQAASSGAVEDRAEEAAKANGERDLSELPLPPGDKSLWGVRDTLNFFLRPTKWGESKLERYGSVFQSKFLFRKTAHILTNQGLETSLTSKSLETNWPPSLVRLMGQNSVISLAPGGEHRTLRKILNPIFSSAAVNRRADELASVCGNRLEQWAQQDSILMAPEARRWSFDLSIEFVFGEGVFPEHEREEVFEAFHFLNGALITLPLEYPGSKFSSALEAREKILDVYRGCVERERALQAGMSEVERKARQDKTLLALLVAQSDDEGQGQGLSGDWVVDNVLAMNFASYDTASTVLMFLIDGLQKGDDGTRSFFRRLRSEVDATAARWEEEGHGPRWSELEQLPLLGAAIKEGLRYMHPVGGGFRIATEDIEIDGYRIPKGWTVLWSIPKNHWDEKNYDRPKDFVPDRWLEGYQPEPPSQCPFSGDLPRGAFLPFGGGVRACPGEALVMLEYRVLLFQAVLRYDWALLEPFEVVNMPTLEPSNGMPMRFTPRGSGTGTGTGTGKE